MMKKVAASIATGAVLVALSASAPLPMAPAVPTDIELACKPRGSVCHTGFECCSQSCQAVNGKDVCH